MLDRPMPRTMQYGSLLRHGALMLAASGALAGCAAMPPAERQAQPRSVSALEVPPAFAGQGAAFPADEWWHAYRDPGLDALIAEGLRNSPDMAMAAARIRGADAIVRQTGAATLPQINAEGSVGGNKQSYNMGIPAQFVPKGVIDTGRLSATLGLDLDLWGRNRTALAAARGEAEAARVDAAQARLMLAGGIALAWGDLAQLVAERAVADDEVRIQTETARLTAARTAEGLANGAELEISKSRLATAQQNLAALDEAIALGRNRIAVLIGAGPGRAASLPLPAISLASPAGVPDNLAANLIGRRPDLVAARLRAEAAAKRVKVARLDFYPNINLAAVAGLQSLGLGQLLSSDSSYASFGPAITLPIFEGGRLRGRYDAASADYQEAVARYNQTLLGALREVADALESRRALSGRLASARAADAAAGEAARLIELRYSQGIASQLDVLAAQDTALGARRAAIDLEARVYLLDVMLVRALGGGFDATTSTKENSK